MSGDGGWTIDELARHAAGALDAAGVGTPNGRVTAAPDRRTIRWYTTIGLVDPPLRTRGRTARYGERHLLQLLAIKRRQAGGRSLTEIQAELAGATDTTLRRIAGPAAPAPPPAPAPAPEPAPDLAAEPVPVPPRPRFWAERPEPPAVPGPVYPIVLHPAVTITVPTAPSADDLAAIQAAARPLLDTLADRGLLNRPGTANAAGRPDKESP